MKRQNSPSGCDPQSRLRRGREYSSSVWQARTPPTPANKTNALPLYQTVKKRNIHM